MIKARTCVQPGCDFTAMKGKRSCGWHWLTKQPISVQLDAADRRLARSSAATGFIHRGRVPEREWPAGGRWCSGCQSIVPLFYCTGSRCQACHGRAARASHVERTYDISGAEEVELLRWQGGRCFVCGRQPVTRRLAVDHDHDTGAVRGLLCSDETWGCNVSLRRILGDPAAAARLLAYTQRSPLERMRSGDPSWSWTPVHLRDDGPPPF